MFLFYYLLMTSSQSLELYYSNVWGPTSLKSFDEYKYYITYLNYVTKYIWLFFMKNKFDVYLVFIKFKCVVEKFFKEK